MKKRGRLVKTVTLALLLASCPLDSLYANSYKEKIELEEKNLKELNDKRDMTDSNISDEQSKLEDISKEQEEIGQEIRKLDEEILGIIEKINKLNEDIKVLEGKINETKIKIDKLKEEIKEKTKLFNERIKIMYKNGGNIATLEVLLSSDGINDFLSRQTMMETLADHDKNLIESLKKDKDELDRLEIELNGQLTTLEASKRSLEEQRVELEDAQKKKNEILKDLVVQEDITAKELEILEGQSDEYKKMIEDKIQEIKELEKEKEKEEERIKEEEKIKEENRRKNTNKSNNSNTKKPVKTNPIKNNDRINYGNSSMKDRGAKFTWPTTSYYITSYYGPRWGRFHGGIDIGAGMGSSVYAGDDGVVIHAGYGIDWSYGQLIIIRHSNGYTTYYAHLSGVDCYVGQKVHRGQHIGRVGSTGNSTGPHLHFEVRQYGSRVNPLGYL